MVVDDSAVIRGMLTRWLEADSNIKVVASAGNGSIALSQLDRADAEIIVLDIEMPVMDGMTALPKLLAKDHNLKIIMASTLTLRNADISLKALAAGAADYIPKPTSTREMQAAQIFQRELVEKVKALGAARRGVTGGKPRAGLPATAGTAAPAPAQAKPGLYGKAVVTLRQPSMQVPQVLAIGSSTGGPQALFKLFETFKNNIKLPIFITQHMPATFTTILAEHLQRISGAACKEAVDGERVQGGHIYIAPGDWHMTVEGTPANAVIRLNQNPPENFCRPAVDPMLRSLAATYGGHVLTVILTGMGHDGLNGGESVVGEGGTVIAQDEASSVVWGMPGAVATGGLCSSVLPLPKIASAVQNLIAGRSL